MQTDRGEANFGEPGIVGSLPGEGKAASLNGSGGFLLRDYDGWLHEFSRISPVGITRADLDGRFTYVNQRWCEMTGCLPEVALGADWRSVVHPEDIALVESTWSLAVTADIPMRVEHRYLRPDGSIVWVQVEAVEERDQKGRVVGFVATATDVTELRRMREELEKSHGALEERVRERTEQLTHLGIIVAEATDAIVSVDIHGIIASWNKSAERIFGYSTREAIGVPITLIAAAHHAEQSSELQRRVYSGETISDFETQRRAKSGEFIDVSLTLFCLRDSRGEAVGVAAVIKDMRERKTAERNLRHLTWKLLRTQDEERRGLARELHDSTAQSMVALALNLSILAKPESARGTVDRMKLLKESADLAAAVGRELRTHSYLLHPPLIEERGLCSALAWFVEGFSSRSSIPVKLEIAPEIGRLSDVAELAIFRVVQESLSNVHRHSQSSAASIRLTCEGQWVILKIRDNGLGIRKNDAELTGVGIAGMKERLANLGGLLTIENADPGTTVFARLPRNA